MKKILFFLSVLWAGIISGQSVTVIQPNGGEVLYACQTYTVKWSQTGSPSNYWNIDYSLDGGTIWTSVASNYLSTNGQFVWTVPNVQSNIVLMRVKDALNGTTVDQSNAVFTINIPIILTSPNGGEVWQAGTVHNITWNAIGTSNTYNIRYSTDGGSSWTNIVTNYNTVSGAYAWTVPYTPSASCLVQVYDYLAYCTNDVSASSFTITPPTPVVTYPNGGELLSQGCTSTITWNASTFYSTVNLYYSLNNGATWTTLGTNLTNDGSENWTVPTTATTTCLVKVANYADPTVYDVSNANFTIKPAITVLTPNGGEIINGCSTYTISWDKSPCIGGSWNGYYSLDNGSTWTQMMFSLANNGSTIQSFVWYVPASISSAQAKIKITNGSYTDLSDATFTINLSNEITLLTPNGGEVIAGGSTYVITWTATANVSGQYGIYYFDGTTNNTISTSATGTSYTWTVPNVAPTQPFCTVTVYDAVNSCKRDVSNSAFTITYVPPTPVVTYPNGGELLSQGCTSTITWNASTFYSTVNLYYSLNNGATWTTLGTNLTNDGSENWTVPTTATTTCLVKVANYADPTVYDVSNANFTIKPAITVLTPNGGEIINGCSTYTISWDKSPCIGGSWNGYYSLDNGSTWTQMMFSLANNGSTIQSFVWYVPASISSAQAKIKITNGSYTDLSDATFTINLSNEITLLTPNGGEVIAGGSTYVITWTATANVSGQYGIYYFDGTTNNTISTSATGTSYTWTVPNVAPTQPFCTVTVYDAVNSCKRDVSNSAFTITYVPPTPVVTYPNGGELLSQGCTSTITWNASTFYSTVNLYYSLNNGATWTTLGTNLTNDGSENWTVPTTATTTCLVKVANYADPTVYDVSNANFTIKPAITVLTPNGGEIINGCSTYTISWDKSPCIGGSWNGYYSLDNGSTWTQMMFSLANNGSTIQSFVWYVPASISSAQAKIKITNGSYTDLSDATFTINLSNEITLLTPNGGEVIAGGSTYVITWTATANVSGQYGIYYFDGTTNNTISTSATGTSYTWTVPNVAPTQPFCTVTVYDAVNSCKRDVSNSAFTITYVPPTPVVTYPNGGELLSQGCTSTITWNASTFYSTVNLYYSLNNGATWTTLGTNLTNDGSENWTVPTTATTTCLVKVANYADPTVYDVSNANFTIKPAITVLTPNGGEIINGCSTYTISWDKSPCIGGSWNGYYSLDNGSTWTQMMFSLANNGSTIQSFVWYVPASISSAQAKIKITNGSYTDLSDATFTINLSNEITLLTPNGGEVIAGGSTYVITWTATANVSGQYGIYYFDGTTNNTISTSATGTSYTWTVPNVAPTQPFCTVTVYDAVNSCKRDVSNSAFTITYVPPTPVVTYPNGGELLSQGCTSTITWNASTFYSTVNLYYSLNNGATWTTLGTNLTNDGSENWTVPTTATTTCLVKVANYADPTVYDVSNANFTIKPAITVLTPNGGEIINGCSTYTISWDKSPCIGGSWNGYYSLDNGSTWTQMMFSLANNGSTIQSFVWYVPASISSAQAKIKITNGSYTDLSDATFTINLSNEITLLTPNGGEVIAGGSTYVITWTATANVSGQYGIYYFDGTTNNTISTSATGTSYTWTVPNVAPTQPFCTVTVYDAVNSCKRDVSNSAFTITYVPPTPVVTYPNGGESFYSGISSTITWSTSTFYSTVNIYYSLDNGATWTTLGTNLTNDGTEPWTVPVGSYTNCLVKVANYADPTVYDVSNAVFTIKPPVTILTPNGDNGITVWGGCTITSITFDHSPAWTNYKLEYSINNGATWNTIIASYAVSGNPSTYNWNIPNSATSQALVRVSPVSVAYTDQSDNTFTITKPVTIIQPNFGGTMQSGTVYPIKWTSDGISNLYDIFYSTNGGASYSTVIIGFNTSINTYSWTVPATVSNNCKVIVRDNINTCKTDTSDQVFIIQAGAPAITLLNPNGLDTLKGCSTYTINWSDAVANGSYNLAYSTNSGSTWTNIATNYTTTTDNYSWVVPNTVNSNNVLVRVQSATTLTTLDQSDALLTIKNGSILATPASTAICSGTSVQLNASGGINYAWSPSGSLTSATISNPVATPTVSTIYTVQSVNGSCTLSNTVNIAVSGTGAPVNATITASPSNSICPGGTVTFSTALSNGGSSPTYQWIVNGVGVGTSTPTYSSNTLSNNDVVKCLVTSNLSCVSNNPAMSNSITMNIVSGQTPSVSVTASPSATICPGTLVTFSANPSYGGTAPTYVWKLNGATVGGSTSTYTNNTLVNGNTVSVIITSNAGCVTTPTASSSPMAITVNTTPAVPSAINGSTLVCANAAYSYTAPAVSGATSYNWTLPGGWSGSSTSNTIAVTTTTNGGVITVQAANACGTSSSRILSVSVGAPTVSIAGTSSLCLGSGVTLTASGATSYTWSTSQTTASITVSPTITTTYSLTGADAGGCTNMTTKTVTVNTLPSVSATSPTICGGSTATVTASGASTYTWNTSATGANLVVTPSVTTNYTVTGTSAAGCTNTSTTSVTVGAAPSISVNSATICTGASATLTASGVNTYTWNTSATTSSIVVTPTATTVYTVNGTMSGCGMTSATTTVVVNTAPSVTVTGPSIYCSGSGPATLTASGASTYTWSTGQTTSSITVTPTITTTYTLIGESSGGCQVTKFKTLTFNAPPGVSVTSPTICGGATATITASGASTYTWNTSAVSSTIVVTPSVTTNYTVTGTDTYGCVKTKTTSVTVGPTPTIAVNSATVCSGTSATLTASGVNTYTWSTSANTFSIVVTPTATTVYTVSGNQTGCTTIATKTTAVVVNASPSVSINTGSPAICTGQSSMLSVSGSATSYTWNTSQTTNSISVTPTTTTTYSVIATDGNGCQNSATKTITVNALPVISASSPTICGGSTATITASGASTYTWNTSATGANLVVTPASTTNYTVTGTSAAGCSNTATTSVTVGSAPSISVNAATVCAGSSATLTASGVTTYTWNTSSNTASIVVTPTANTVYTVTGNLSGCTTVATNTTMVMVNASPSVSITASSASICVGQSVNLMVSGSVTSYTWNTSQTTTSISVTPTTTTTYSIIGTDGNGCQNSASNVIPVNALSVISVTSPTICGGATATVTASGAATYTWNTSATGAGLVVTPASTTNYTVTGTSAAGCVNTTTTSVTVGPAPSISVSAATVCAGTSATLTAVGVTTYTWSTSENTASIVVTPNSTTVYSVSGNDPGCAVTASNTVAVTVNALPTLTVNAANSSFCEGGSTGLTVSGSATSYTWSTSETATTITVTPLSTTTYSIVGEDGNGCKNSTTSMITVNPLPVINVSNSTICAGGTTTLSASGATTYTWNTGANGQNLVVSPIANTDYTVTGESAFGCVNTATASVTITSAPIISVNSETICSGSSAVLVASGVSTYTWSTGENTSTINVTPGSTAEYTVSGQAAGCGVTANETATITVNSSPTVTAISSVVLICAGETATLSAGGATTYTWNTNETTPDIVVNPSTTTVYTVTGDGGNGCTNSALVTQSVSLCTGLVNSTVLNIELNIIPNPFRSSFTVSSPLTTGMEIRITDVLGKVIYTVKPDKETIEIDLSNQSSGIYFVYVNTLQGIVTKKIIKE